MPKVGSKHYSYTAKGMAKAKAAAKKTGKKVQYGKKKKEMSKGLYANIHAKRKRIKAGSGEKMRKPGSKGAPSAKAFKQAAKTVRKKKVRIGMMYPNQPYVSGMFQQAISNMQGQVPAIQQYLQQNPNLTDLQYYQAARQANISPLAIAMATKSDPMQVYNRYQTAQQQFQQMQPQQPPPPGMFNQAVQRFGEDQALQAILRQTPLAPVAPFVGPIRTGVRLLGGLF